MHWWKAFHIIAIVAWFAGLFYLPRLYVYHASCQDKISLSRFKLMERRLYYGIMWPAAILSTGFGVMTLSYNVGYFMSAHWMHAKLTLVLLVWGYHWLCGHYRLAFARDANQHSERFFRWFNELPTLLLIGIVILVTVKPF